MTSFQQHLDDQDELTEAYEQRELEARQRAARQFLVGYDYAPPGMDRTTITLHLSLEAARHLADASERMGYHDGDEALAAHVTSVLRQALGQPPAPDLQPEPAPEPREFTVSLGVSVRAYGTTTVMAHSMAEALEIVRAQTEAYNDDAIQDQCVWDQVTDVDWGTQFDYTLLSISDDEGDEEDIDDIELCDPKKPYEVISADALRSLIEAEE